MTTNNSVNTNLSGQTGTGTFVGSVSPTITGTAIASSIQFSPSTNGLIGTTTNNNAAAGYVGEIISSIVPSGSAISIASPNTAYNVTSISLSAGDWDVYGNVSCLYTSGSYSAIAVWTSTTSALAPDNSLWNEISGLTIAGNIAQATPTLRYSLSGMATIYLSVQTVYVTASISACGGIYARRAR